MKELLIGFVAFAFLIQGVVADSVATLAGTGSKGFSGDRRAATKAKLNNVYGVGRGPDGYLYFCDMDNARIRRVNPAGNIETYAGNGKRGFDGDGGSAERASLSMPYEMAWDQQGNLYVVDLGNHNERRIDGKTRKISTIVGTGKAGFGGDGGPAAAAQLNQPHSLAFDAADNLYICDIMNHRIRRVDRKTGIISTWCGTGEAKTARDGSPIQGSPVHGPRAITFAADGTCYLALREGNAVLLLDPKKDRIQRIAGNGKQGFTGNGGPALQATLSGPKGIALDAAGNVYLADTESHSIRVIDMKRGIIDVIVGNGSPGDGPDGNAPTDCKLARPHGVFVEKDGSVLIGDSENHRVRVWKKN